MKKIKLTRGYYAKIDNDDFEYLSKWQWRVMEHPLNSKGSVLRYAYRYENHYATYLHREILGLKKGDGKMVDHANGDGLDNRRNNLRVCTRSENARNRRKWVLKAKQSKYKGVSIIPNPKSPKFGVAVMVDGKNKHFGCFESEIEAAKKYNEIASKFYGKFAKLNKF